MAGLNKVTLIGHLGSDPEVTYSQGGMAICKFSLATTERRKNADGEWENSTEWHRIVLFGKTAEIAEQYLSKGRQVYIEGKITYRKWEKDGETQYYTDIICNNLIMLGKKEDSESAPPKSSSKSKPADHPNAPSDHVNEEEQTDDDLPF